MPGTRLQLVVVTGFLGSGKTTHLQRLLGARRDDVAVVVNELADVGVDQQLLAAQCARVIAVTGGCACCERLGQMLDALRLLLDEHERGTLKLRQVIVETSGLADPLPIVSAVVGDPVLRHHFVLESVIAVVDGIEGLRQLDQHAEARRQVLGADEVFVSKTDLAGRVEVDALRRRLKTLGPGPGEHTHTPEVVSVAIEFPSQVDWIAFGVWLSLLVHAHGPRLLRIKGIVPAQGMGAIAVNGVQRTLFPPEHVKAASRDARFVVIAQGLKGEAIRRSLFAFQRAA